MDLSTDQVKHALLYLIAFIVSVSVHEFGHAWMANRLGDKLPRMQGRLTLSPLAHIDPLGTILLPLIGALAPVGMPLIAWGKPVQTNPNDYTRRLSRKVGHMLVALAGPFMNLLMAVAISVVFIVLSRAGLLSLDAKEAIVRYLLALNITLMFFNLIPLPPLDGGAVLMGILPRSMEAVGAILQRYGMLILLGLVLIPGAMRVLMTPAMQLTGGWVRLLVRLGTA